jgi:transposase
MLNSFFVSVTMVKKKGKVAIRHNCRGRMDDIGFAFLQDWSKRQEGSLTERAKWLNVSRHCIRDNLTHTRCPSQRSPHRPPSVSEATQTQVALRRVLVKQLAKETKIVIGKKYSPVRRCLTTKKTTLRCFPTVPAMKREIGREHGHVTSLRTLRRDLQAEGMLCKIRSRGPWHQPKHLVARLKMCEGVQTGTEEEIAANVDKVHFSDEKWADCHGGQVRTQWCEEDEEPHPKESEQKADKIRVWGMIGIGFKHMVILPHKGSITSAFYQKHMIQPVLAHLQRPDCVFMQDGAGCHRGLRQWLKDHGVNTMVWPSKSPDLNPIENLWARIDRQVNQHGPWSRDELAKFWREEWDAIPQAEIDSLVRSFNRRTKECIQRKGALLV